MRGDSLRDLYAKTIAVCGLGLLAGAGALVDYWPTGVVLPFVRSGFPEPALVGALPVPDHALEVPALDAIAPPASRPSRRVVMPPALAVNAVQDFSFGGIVALTTPPQSMFSPVAVHATTGHEVALTAPSEPTMTMAMYTAPVASGSDDNNGFISGAAGAFKKTGSSIANAGSKTGASIVGAFRTVTGVMRRVNPFN